MFNRDHRIPAQIKFAAALLLSIAASPAHASRKANPIAPNFPDAARLRSIVQGVVDRGSAKNGGMGNQEWAAIVNRDGVVCAIVFSGTTRSDQWPGSRVIAASKASTANGLSGRDYRALDRQYLRRLATRAKPLQPGHQRAAQSEAVFGDSGHVWHAERSDGRQGHRRQSSSSAADFRSMRRRKNCRRSRSERRHLMHRPHRRLEGAPRTASRRGAHGSQSRAQRQHDP